MTIGRMFDTYVKGHLSDIFPEDYFRPDRYPYNNADGRPAGSNRVGLPLEVKYAKFGASDNGTPTSTSAFRTEYPLPAPVAQKGMSRKP